MKICVTGFHDQNANMPYIIELKSVKLFFATSDMKIGSESVPSTAA